MNFMHQQYTILLLFFFKVVMASTIAEPEPYEETSPLYDFESTASDYDTTANSSDETPNDDKIEYALTVVSVIPVEIVVDSTTELQLSITNYTGNTSIPMFCFLTTPDHDLKILPSSWISLTQINCTGFEPLVPGSFSVAAGSNVPINYDQKATIKVISKHPVAELAEYSNNFDKMSVHFDGNIELYSSCAEAFTKNSVEYFGTGFKCTTVGNVLVVKMGTDFKPTEVVEISPGNKICRSGSVKEFCLSAEPKHLEVKTPKVSGPKLSLLIMSDCAGNASHMSLKLSSGDGRTNSKKVSQEQSSGQSQRRNLMVWRTFRRMQHKLPSNLTFKIEKADMQPLYENLAAVENFLENNIQQESSSSGVTVSINVQSFTTAVISAEANVIFCNNFNQLFRYTWVINENPVPESGKLITIRNATPGKHVIKCFIVAYNSSDILAQAWAMTEVLESKPKVIVYPVEIVLGKMEDFTLHAVGWNDGMMSWACETNTGEDCMTNAQKLIKDVVDMKKCDVTILAGILPVGKYTWSVQNAEGVNTSRVIIKSENTIAIDVKIASLFVDRSQNIILRGKVKGLQNGCRLWWSGSRHRGFNYVNIQTAGGNAEVLIEDGKSQQEIHMILLPHQINLIPDSLYIFELQTFCPQSGSVAYSKIPIGINDPPRISPIKIEPRKGLAMATDFTITEVRAEDTIEDYPLMFEWSYLDTCDIEIPISRGAYARQITTFLPPGDIRVVLRVCDVKGGCSNVSSSVTEVSHSKIVSENYHAAANRIFYLLVAGDYLEALGLAVTVFKSLALKAETDIRREVLKSVEEGVRIRIKEFNENMATNPKSARLSLDFIERALTVVKYFPKNSGIEKYLTDFQQEILNEPEKPDLIKKTDATLF